MDRRDFIGRTAATTLVAGAAPWSAPALAQIGGYVEGQHYLRLATPLQVSVPAGKLEVIEFFSYACPHCFAFDPALDAWVKKLPADVVFHRVPVPFLMNAENFQRTYFALEALGPIEAAHARIFKAVHLERKVPSQPEQLADLVAQAGVDRAKFLSTFASFGVNAKLAQAKTLMERYKVNGVPTLGIHGRFVTSPSMVGQDALPELESQSRALVLADQLLAQVRKG